MKKKFCTHQIQKVGLLPTKLSIDEVVLATVEFFESRLKGALTNFFSSKSDESSSSSSLSSQNDDLRADFTVLLRRDSYCC